MGNNIEKHLIQAYDSYDPDADYTGEIGHRLADAITKQARSERKNVSDWLGEKRRNRVLRRSHIFKKTPEKEVAQIIYDSLIHPRSLMGNAYSLLRNILEKNGYHRIETGNNSIPTSKASARMIVEYSKSLLHKYDFPLEPSQHL